MGKLVLGGKADAEIQFRSRRDVALRDVVSGHSVRPRWDIALTGSDHVPSLLPTSLLGINTRIVPMIVVTSVFLGFFFFQNDNNKEQEVFSCAGNSAERLALTRTKKFPFPFRLWNSPREPLLN